MSTPAIEVPKWAKGAMDRKVLWAARNKPGWLPPTIWVERSGEVLCIATAPDVEKMLGYRAAEMLCRGFQPDAITGAFDSFGKPQKEGERFRPGQLQEEARHGALERGEVREALFVVRVTKNTTETCLLPYRSEGKRARWNREEFRWTGEGLTSGGAVVEVLNAIINVDPLTDAPELERLRVEHGLDEERARFHASRATMTFLRGLGYDVIDNLSHKHLDWTDWEP
jgi:hypothetical protein